jgi:hypothetical protein
MVAVLNMAAAAATSTDMVPPIATENKHRSRYGRLPAFADESGMAVTGCPPASESKPGTAHWLKVKNQNAPAAVFAPRQASLTAR